MTKNAVALVRVSTAIQEHGVGLKRQRDEIDKFKRDNPDYDEVRTIEEIGKSAFSGLVHSSSSEFGQFLESLEENPSLAPDALLLPSLDRLTRLPYFEATSLIGRILDVIPEIVICDSGDVYSSTSKELGSIMALTLKIQLAHKESELKSERLRDARERRKGELASKKKILNKPPYWITWNGEDYVFNDNVKAIKKMVELRLSGLGSVSIQAHLNENLDKYPAPTKAGRWTKSRIDDILFKEPTITGDYLIKTTYTPEEKSIAKKKKIKLPAYNRELDHIIEGLFPAVVDRVTFHKLKSGTGKGKQTNSHYNVLRSITKCTCGSGLVLSHDTKKQNLDDRIYLKCNARNQSGRVSICRNPSTKLFPLVRSILNYLINFPLTATEGQTKVSRADELELQIKEQKELRDRFRRLSTKAATEEDEDYYLSELKTVSGTLKALEVEYKLAVHEEANSADSNIVLENLKKVRIDTPEGRLEVNSQLRQIIDVMVIDNIAPLVKVTFKDGTVTEFDPNEVGDIAETHDYAFNYDRDQEDDLSDFDFND